MEGFVDDMHLTGVCIDVEITYGWKVTKGFLKIGQKPPCMMVKALIDTGADASCIDTAVCDALCMKRTGGKRVEMATGVKELPMVDVVLNIKELNRCFPLSALVIDLSNNSFKVIIGRDILRKCRFEYDGRREWYRLTVRDDE